MSKHIEIITFLKLLKQSHSTIENIFTNGSCYYLFLMLSAIYDEAEAYYNDDHIITKIDGRFYDITGEIKDPEILKSYLNLNEHYVRDSSTYIRIVSELLQVD